ncbi:MAG: hypothetical protein QOJ90_2405 [Actinomycetota bacterium]|nr:hypothetical protein [Actinomycetota bacterium]MDQ1643054.1 hypothetical protein [Actinomycetota bacterium]
MSGGDRPGGGARGRAFRVGLLVLVVALIPATSVGLLSFKASAEQALTAQRDLASVGTQMASQDAQEWRARARVDPVEVRQALVISRAEVDRLLSRPALVQALHGRLDRIRRAERAYTVAVDLELALLVADKHSAALAFDKETLDPAFRVISGELDLGTQELNSRARFAARVSDGGIVLIVLVFSGLVLVAHRYRRRSDLRQRADVEHLALHDPLTSLPNRRLFLDRVERALDVQRHGGSTSCLLYLDLDDFKAVNDTLGHAAGDELLVEVTRRLKNSVYPTDTLCRLGGDEFAVLLGSVDADSGRRSAERLLSLISENFSIAGRSIRVSASVGVAVLDGSWSVASEVLTAADQAMYAAKRQGKSCVILHEHHMSLAAARHGQLTQALREGLLLGEVSVAYQPIVELCSGTALGFEALARWHNPVHGQINPVEFVALAEGSGAIHELGQLVLETGCRDIASVNATRNPDDRPLGLAVNVSTVQLKRRDLVHDVVRALQASGLPAALLTVEITEGTALSADCLPVLNEIRALGVGVALDDFGTGFASLTHVTSLPITQLKIDRSFVDDLIDRDGDALIAAVLALGRQLDLEVVAEGVETEAQRARLEELGCVRAQGYLFARPMTIDALRVHMAPDEPRLRLLPG